MYSQNKRSEYKQNAIVLQYDGGGVLSRGRQAHTDDGIVIRVIRQI